MKKVLSDFSVGKYRILKLDGEIPKKKYTKFLIGGVEYKPVPIYEEVN